MIARLLITTSMLFSMPAIAAESGTGETIFDRKCAHCHTLSRTKAMLNPVKEEDRPAHLSKYLRTHPSKLGDDDERLVIELLSRPGK